MSDLINGVSVDTLREVDANIAAAEIPVDRKRMLAARVKHDFTYHSPNPSQVERMARMRNEVRELALLMIDYSPVSREQSLALTSLEEAVMWFNAAIARNE